MNALAYILLSILDGIAIFTFSFGSFRVKIKDYWKEILITNIIISIGSYFQKEKEVLSTLTPAINIIILLLALILIFRISLLASLRISVFGFVAQLIFQSIIAIIFMIVTNMRFGEVTNQFGYAVQIIGDLSMISLSLVLQKRKIWFTTLPYSYTYKFKISRLNVVIFITSLVAILLMNKSNFDDIYLCLTFWGACFVNLLVAEIKKEVRGEID